MENNTLNPNSSNQNNEVPESQENTAPAPGEQVSAAPAQPQPEQTQSAEQPPVTEAPAEPSEPVVSEPVVSAEPTASADAATSAESSAPAASESPTPAVSPLAVSPTVGSAAGGHKKFATLAVGLVALVVGLAAGFVGAAATGTSFVKDDTNKVAAPAVNEEKELTIPEGAEVINECAKGRGKQYVLPKDLPMGPVYNVWEGKVTSIEYMPGQKEVLANENFMNLPLENVKYDHMNIGLLSQGHAGYPEPHYHVDVFTIPHEEANEITCE